MNYTLHIENAQSTHDFYEVKTPFDGQILGSVEKADAPACEQALQNAEISHQTIMKSMPAWRRAEILYGVADLMKKNHEFLAMQIAQEGGKPLKDALVEVTRAINTVKMSGDEALQLNGEQLTMDRAKGSESQLAFTMRVPIGPVLAISAFNHPLNLIAHQVATAIAAGNSVIVKPASQTALSCLTLVDYFYQAGLPKTCLSVVTVGGAAMSSLVSDPRIRFVTFIGGEEVGWELRKQIAPGTKISLELGGIGTAILDKTADLKRAIPSIIKSAFYHAGQVCVSLQNLYIHQDIMEDVVPLLLEEIKKLQTGDSALPTTDVGPLIHKKEITRVLDLIEQSIAKGAELLAGKEVINETCLTPTLLKSPTSDLPITSREVFGPVMTIIPYKDIPSVIAEMNSRPYSFQSAIYTKDIDLALHCAKQIECMGFMINNPTAFRVDWMPFGGSKKSGMGVGGIKYSIHEMTEEKLVVMNVDSTQF